MNLYVGSSELANLAADCTDIAGTLSAGAKVGSQSGAAATAMPGGSAPGALEGACSEIDKAVSDLVTAMNATADAARDTQATLTSTDGQSADGLNDLGVHIENHGYEGYGG